jgi:hypothetical protein
MLSWRLCSPHTSNFSIYCYILFRKPNPMCITATQVQNVSYSRARSSLPESKLKNRFHTGRSLWAVVDDAPLQAPLLRGSEDLVDLDISSGEGQNKAPVGCETTVNRYVT